jgi:hypothetical protein
MALIKIQRFFGAVPNDLLNNPDISFKAKGLYAYLNSKPDDWDFSVERISTQVKEGIDSVRAGIHELEKFNYLKRIKRQNEKGFWEVDYMLFECPLEAESFLGKSNEGETHKQYKKEEQRKNIPPKSPRSKSEFVPPSEADVIAYFSQHGQPEAQARKAFAHYNNFDWKDSRGTQVKNWKQKMFTNWFTETPASTTITEPDGDARVMAFFERGYKSCTKDELKWIFEWQHRAPAIHLKYPNNIRLVRADSPLTKQDAIDADRAAGY